VRLTRRAGVAIALSLGVAACARPGGGPEGGPPDVAPPQLVRVTPDSGRTGVRPNAVVFRFDEVVSERPAGVPSLDRLFVVSPRDGNLNVDWQRDAITVRPRRGWRPNTTYTISMLPGVADLRNNVSKRGASVTFSTGPTIPHTSISGVAFDWAQGRPPTRGFIEAYLPGDTAFVWIAPLDSVGTFRLRALPPNRYVVRAFSDDNNNSAFDSREAFDSAVVSLTDSARLELYAFVHDTVGPRIESVTPEDSVTLRVKLDRPLLPTLAITPALFSLRGADSVALQILSAQPATLFDSLRSARAGSAADSLARSNPDSARRIDPRFQARRDSASAARVDSLRRLVTGDTAARAAVAPRMNRPRPVSDVVLTLAAPLKPATLYRLQARATGLLARERTSDRSFRTAAPPKPASDSTKATPVPRPPRATSTPATAIPPSAVPARPDSAVRPPVRVP